MCTVDGHPRQAHLAGGLRCSPGVSGGHRAVRTDWWRCRGPVAEARVPTSQPGRSTESSLVWTCLLSSGPRTFLSSGATSLCFSLPRALHAAAPRCHHTSVQAQTQQLSLCHRTLRFVGGTELLAGPHPSRSGLSCSTLTHCPQRTTGPRDPPPSHSTQALVTASPNPAAPAPQGTPEAGQPGLNEGTPLWALTGFLGAVA